MIEEKETKIDVAKIGDSVPKGIRNAGTGITNLFGKKDSKKKR